MRKDEAHVQRYSHFFSTLYDETEPVGTLGRGTHYSVLRSLAGLLIPGKSVTVGALTYTFPGVRFALWFGGALVIGGGLYARLELLRMGREEASQGHPTRPARPYAAPGRSSAPAPSATEVTPGPTASTTPAIS